MTEETILGVEILGAEILVEVTEAVTGVVSGRTEARGKCIR